MKRPKVFFAIFLILAMIITLLSCAKSDSSINVEDENVLNTKTTYHGTAMGYNDLINVDVTLDDGKILDVEVVSHSETPGIGGELKDIDGKLVSNGGEAPITLIPRLMVENQSINIDTVTGATVTCYGIEHAVADAMVKAGLRVDAVSSATEENDDFKNKNELVLPEKTKKELEKYLDRVHFDIKNEDLATDVVVIGSGGAGLTAAISASKNNANVIIVEKNGEVGGNTLVCGAIYNAPDKELQKKLTMMSEEKIGVIEKALNETPVSEEHKKLQDKVRVELEEFKSLNNELTGGAGVFDSESWFALQTFNGGDKIANLTLVETFADNAFKTLELLKNMGFKIYDGISQGAGALWERTHTSVMPMGTGIISTLLNEINKHNNIKILTHVEAKEIIVNDNKEVIGVKCIDKNKNEFTISTKKGVVIATGGFSANKEMLNAYNTKWKDLNDATTTNRETSSNGDGIKMGISINANTVDMDQIQLLYLGNVQNGKLTRYPKRDVNAVDEIIFIDKNGNRFVNEGDRRDVISESILNLDENFFYILESGDGDDYVDIYGNDFESADGFSLDYLIKNEYIYVGDTLEELCEKINVPVENLKATLEDFNKYVDGEKKDTFGRTLYSTKLTKGPYVATPRKVSVHHTMGGLKINEKAQVLDTDNNVIKGLYAAGEVTGGIHGANRLGGNAVADITIFGTIAGDNISKE
ncbi:MAG: flavocytochrome c [Lachnospiraceae bacterium]|nr:flavocytochrome c [Lachnospiraceae bacterium]